MKVGIVVSNFYPKISKMLIDGAISKLKNNRISNFKKIIVPGTYEVKISKKLLSQFKSSEYDLTYYIALEPDVTWED